ncbi:hypothetical protein D3C86_2146200 [compost metagenome]
MRQVGTGHDQVARREIADIVADEVLAAGVGDQLDFIFRMKVPAHGAVGVAV